MANGKRDGETMTYQEFVNRWFGFEIDVNDLSEVDDEMLTEMWRKEIEEI